MRHVVFVGLLSLLALAPFGRTGPMNGGFFEGIKEDDRSLKRTARFRGGEKAMVIARGRDGSSAVLTVTITDSKGKVVAQTTGKEPPNAAMVAVFWYPPRDEEYTIDVSNSDSRPNSVFVTVK